jgi:hypothetical protein
MKIGWGWKITLLYTSFVVMMVTLVVASSRQKFDLVSKDYYKEELAYQNVIDAGKNLAGLSTPVAIHANETDVTIEFPKEFNEKAISGHIKFYSAVDAAWDRTFDINAGNNVVTIPRSALQKTRYTIKISCVVDEKNYYRESEIQL